MSYTKSYYSLIQYCPDESRAEAVNLGVVLLCPDLGFLDLLTSQTHDRVERLFGRGSFDPQRLTDATIAIENRLRGECREGIRTYEDLSRFAHNRANTLLMTVPRPVKIAAPERDLRQLFQTLVEEQPRADVLVKTRVPNGDSRMLRRLDELFSRPRIRQARVEKPKVVVPVVGTIVQSSYGFQNGKLNVVVPMKLTKQLKDRALKLATAGELLREHENEMATPAALWITLPNPDDTKLDEDLGRVKALFEEYHIPVYGEEDFDALEHEMEAVLH